MTDNEIIKALECCSRGSGDRQDWCTDCSARGRLEDCETELPEKALDLINRQKAEIERLRKETPQTIESIRKLARDTIRDTKAEAVKEFAERLKRALPNVFYGKTVVIDAVDNLVKEMTEENNIENNLNGGEVWW